MEQLAPSDLDRFRGIVARRLGLRFDDAKTKLLADVLRKRLRSINSASAAAYLASIESAADGREEMRALATQLTVNETYFFRDAGQFRALAEVVIPQRIVARASIKRLRLLSAGCASGEEPYSVAIVLSERFPELRSWDLQILGLDISAAMIAKAKNARYHGWSFRETPPQLRDKYFQRDGDDFTVEKRVRDMVCVEEQNLASGGWTDLKQFDIILCRNMIMYLTPDAAHTVIASLTRALVPEGFLFLGYAESLRGISRDYHLCETHNTFYYQKRPGAFSPGASPAEPRRTPIKGALGDQANIAWVDAVRQASERIHRLSGSNAGPANERRDAAGRSAVELGFVVEMLRQERFREALEVLGEVPPETAGDADVQLLRAGLLTNSGDLETAEAVCRQILAADNLNPGAHYLTALCREFVGDVKSAMEHDRAAIHLDATFAMAHLHLGRMAKRSADLTTARRELEYAATLLSREEPARILLFGGGFSREALVAFSHAELRACGGVP